MVPVTGVVPALMAVNVSPGAVTGPEGVKFVCVQVGFAAGGEPGLNRQVTVLPATMVPPLGEQTTEAATVVKATETESGVKTTPVDVGLIVVLSTTASVTVTVATPLA